MTRFHLKYTALREREREREREIERERERKRERNRERERENHRLLLNDRITSPNFILG